MLIGKIPIKPESYKIVWKSLKMSWRILINFHFIDIINLAYIFGFNLISTHRSSRLDNFTYIIKGKCRRFFFPLILI